MKRSRLLGTVGAGLVMSLVGFVGTAHADTADDVAIILDNLPAATDALSAGVQDAVDTLAATQSAEQTSRKLGQALVNAGFQLVSGTEQFGQLGTGLSLFNGSVQAALAPYLRAIDDPSTAGGLVNPDDLGTILGNIGPAVADAEPHLKSAVIEALRGNLTEDLFGGFIPGLGTPAVLGDTLQAIAASAPFVLGPSGFFTVLVSNTNLVPVDAAIRVATLLAAGLADSQLQPIEDNLAPLFAGLAPATEPLIAVLEGV